jgi:hypothetical protein
MTYSMLSIKHKEFTKPITDLKSHVNKKKLTHGDVEHHGDIWLGPGELYAEPPVLPRHAVLKRTLVEEVGGELAQLRMHPVQMEFFDISLTKGSSLLPHVLFAVSSTRGFLK